MKKLSTGFAVAGSLLLLCAPAWADWSLPMGANVHAPYVGQVPAKSDVVFSARFKRPQAAEVAKSYGATRIEWVYPTDAEFVAGLKKAAPWFGGTVNSNGPLPTDAGWTRDFDGNIIQPARLKGWGGRWVTTTNPETERVINQQVGEFLALGAKSIQVDGPILQMSTALYQAGDFNPSTLAGFNRYLASYPNQAIVKSAGLAGLDTDYREFLKSRYGVKNNQDYIKRFRTFPSTRLWLSYIRSTVELHYTSLRETLQKAPGGPVALSLNLTTLTEPDEKDRLFFLLHFADYALTETYIKDPVEMRSQAATMRAFGVGYVPSIVPLETADNRVAIASLYALGAPALVPWDTYVGNDAEGKAQRFFAKTGDLVDLYSFVRQNKTLFDGFETAAVVGLVVPIDRFKSDTVRPLIADFHQHNIPFAYVPVGGQDRPIAPDQGRLKNFRNLVLTNPDADYRPSDLAALAASGVRLIRATDMNPKALDVLQPFIVAPGAMTTRIYPRAVPNRPDRLVVHVIDETKGGMPAPDTTCRRRLGIHKSMLGNASVESANWVTPQGTRPVKVDSSRDDFLMSIDDCPLWGALTLTLKP